MANFSLTLCWIPCQYMLADRRARVILIPACPPVGVSRNSYKFLFLSMEYLLKEWSTFVGNNALIILKFDYSLPFCFRSFCNFCKSESVLFFCDKMDKKSNKGLENKRNWNDDGMSFLDKASGTFFIFQVYMILCNHIPVI